MEFFIEIYITLCLIFGPTRGLWSAWSILNSWKQWNDYDNTTKVITILFYSPHENILLVVIKVVGAGLKPKAQH